jgi:hypothetical protein
MLCTAWARTLYLSFHKEEVPLYVLVSESTSQSDGCGSFCSAAVAFLLGESEQWLALCVCVGRHSFLQHELRGRAVSQLLAVLCCYDVVAFVLQVQNLLRELQCWAVGCVAAVFADLPRQPSICSARQACGAAHRVQQHLRTVRYSLQQLPLSVSSAA